MDSIQNNSYVSDTVNELEINLTIATHFNTRYRVIVPKSNIGVRIYLFSGRKFCMCYDSVVKHDLWDS
jgi:hypothetical protein